MTGDTPLGGCCAEGLSVRSRLLRESDPCPSGRHPVQSDAARSKLLPGFDGVGSIRFVPRTFKAVTAVMPAFGQNRIWPKNPNLANLFS